MEVKKLIVIAIGGWLGTLFALELLPNTLHSWAIGALTGFLAGYIGYDLEDFVRAIPRAFRYAITTYKTYLEGIWKIIVKPRFFLAIDLAISFLLANIFYSYISNINYSRKEVELLEPTLLLFCVVTIILYKIRVSVLSALSDDSKWHKIAGDYYTEMRFMEGGKIYRSLRFCHISQLYEFGLLETIRYYGICFIVATWVTIESLWLVMVAFFVLTIGMPLVICIEAIVFLKKFVSHLFYLVHSDNRLVCGTHAAFGAGIGAFYGSAIMGAGIGLFTGILDIMIAHKMQKQGI